MFGEDLFGSHAVREQRHRRHDRKAQPPDAGLTAHDSGVCDDALVGHEFMLVAALSQPRHARFSGPQVGW
jgi:hypothetical protein